jgi:hypothetical protein
MIFYFSKFFNTNLVNDLNLMKESVWHTELVLHFSAVVVKQYLMFMFVPAINCWLWNHCVCFHKYICYYWISYLFTFLCSLSHNREWTVSWCNSAYPESSVTQAVPSEIHSILILLHVDNFISWMDCKFQELFDSVMVGFPVFRQQQVMGE